MSAFKEEPTPIASTDNTKDPYQKYVDDFSRTLSSALRYFDNATKKSTPTIPIIINSSTTAMLKTSGTFSAEKDKPQIYLDLIEAIYKGNSNISHEAAHYVRYSILGREIFSSDYAVRAIEEACAIFSAFAFTLSEVEKTSNKMALTRSFIIEGLAIDYVDTHFESKPPNIVALLLIEEFRRRNIAEPANYTLAMQKTLQNIFETLDCSEHDTGLGSGLLLFAVNDFDVNKTLFKALTLSNKQLATEVGNSLAKNPDGIKDVIMQATKELAVSRMEIPE